MKKIEFIELRFSNILSYGNNINTFTFRDGVSWLKGSNGAGKSTCVEALTYVLFGTPYRDLTLDNLINTTNKKKLLVELDFKVIEPSREVKYTIRRGMKSKVFSVFEVRDDETTIEISKEAGFAQSSLEKNILGFDIRLFKNVISLNTLETKPFLDMKPDEKRKLIESIITIDISKYKKKLANDLSLSTTKFSTSENDVKFYNNKLVELSQLLSTIENEKKVDIAKMKDSIISYNKELEEGTGKIELINKDIKKIQDIGKLAVDKLSELKKISDRINNINQVISLIEESSKIRVSFNSNTEKMISLNKTLEKSVKLEEKNKNKLQELKEKMSSFVDLEKNLNELTTKSHVLKSKMEDILKAKDEITVGVPCPTCGKPSTEEDKENLINKYREDWKELNKQIKPINSTISELNIQLESKNKLTEEYNTLNIEFVKSQSEVSSLKKEIQTLDSSISELSRILTANKDKSDKLVPDFNIDKDNPELLNKKVEELTESIKEMSVLEEEIKNLKESLNSKKTEVAVIESNNNKIKQSIDQLVKEIEEKENSSKTDSIGITKKQIEDARKSIEDSKTELLKSSDEIQLYRYMGEMLGDEGIKKVVISSFVPVLNKTIERNLRKFDLPFSIEFDESLDFKFYGTQGSAPVYEALSQGQRRKLHFSISMAFRDFVSIIGNFAINILFLDEVLDISVDDIGLECMVDILKTKVNDIGGIYVMTHRGESFSNDWSSIVEIKHDGTFSELVNVTKP